MDVPPTTLVRTLFDHLNGGDLDAMRPHAAEDEFQDLPMVGHIEGRDAVFEHFEAVLAALPDIHFDLDRIVGEGETVYVTWRLTGTFTGAPFYGVAATGRRIDIRGMDRFTIRDGKVASVFAGYDSMDFAIQAGLLPPIDSPAQRAMVHAINALTAIRRRLRR
ncbi:MAG TPA: nuclear transport factor 2 family protein [Solirubrobacterales bacterium]|nr:nuclear transport factor 2 family protein [Solirubrobacterales bacterium]